MNIMNMVWVNLNDKIHTFIVHHDIFGDDDDKKQKQKDDNEKTRKQILKYRNYSSKFMTDFKEIQKNKKNGDKNEDETKDKDKKEEGKLMTYSFGYNYNYLKLNPSYSSLYSELISNQIYNITLNKGKIMINDINTKANDVNDNAYFYGVFTNDSFPLPCLL